MTVSLAWAFVVILLGFRDFLIHSVSKRNPRIIVPNHKGVFIALIALPLNLSFHR
jgi:hypothetical protein